MSIEATEKWNSSELRRTLHLRRDLKLEEAPESGLKILDPATQRSFCMDEMQGALIREMDGLHTPEELATGLFGASSELANVEKFIARLRALALLDEDLPFEAIAERQANTLRDVAKDGRDKKVASVIAWAGSSIPLYAERFGPIADQIGGIKDLPRLPTMTKSDVRENFPGRLLPDGMSGAELMEKGQVWLYSTSGTTGNRLQVFYDATRTGYPQSFPGIRPVRGGWSEAKIALFTTPICSGTVCHMGKTSYEDRLTHGGAYLSLNSSDRVMSLTRPELLAIVEDFERFQPSILRVDPIYAVALVRALERESLPIPKVDVIWTAYEYCSVLHRPVLERAFGVPVFTVYAATDLGGGCQAFRCERGVFHVRQNQYVFEFLHRGVPVAPGELGEITVTSLYHRFMPLVRYCVEDIARPLEQTCSCSHGDWPAFQLEGRLRDCMLDTSRRLVTTRAFDDLFEGLSWIDHYQMTQRSLRAYELLVVRRPDTDEADAEVFLDRARSLLGHDAHIRIRNVREIPTEKSFKFRLTGSTVWTPRSFEWH